MDDAGPLVLVVDDVVAIVEELVDLLALRGIAAIGAHALREAIALLEQEPTIRIVACDVRLGRESGLEIIALVGANPALSERLFHYVFVTGDPMTIGNLSAIPDASILTKPVQPKALIQLFRELLDQDS